MTTSPIPRRRTSAATASRTGGPATSRWAATSGCSRISARRRPPGGRGAGIGHGPIVARSAAPRGVPSPGRARILGPMRRVEADALVGASRDEVWELYDDIAGMPRWVPSVREIRYVSGPARVGTVYRERTRIAGIPGTAQWEITEHRRPVRQVHVSTGESLGRRRVITFEARGSGTWVHQVGRGPLLAVGARRAGCTSCSRCSPPAGPCARRSRAPSAPSRATLAAEAGAAAGRRSAGAEPGNRERTAWGDRFGAPQPPGIPPEGRRAAPCGPNVGGPFDGRTVRPRSRGR